MNIGQKMNVIKEKYHKVQNAYDHIVQWKYICDNPPNNFPVYTPKNKIKDQILLNMRKSILNNMENT